MRILIRASIPVEIGNRAIQDGMLPKAIREFTEKAKPESQYFTLHEGRRTMFAVIDLKDLSHIPMLLEPLFTHLHAAIDYAPCMNGEDLAKGLQLLANK